MDDEPEMDVGGVGDVGEPAQRRIGQGVGAQDDQRACALGA